MGKLNGMAVVKAEPYKGRNVDGTFITAKEDSNHKMPIILVPIAGVIPSKRVLAGTIADSLGVIAGKTYLVKFKEIAEDEEFGRQFQWTVIGAASLTEVFTFSKELPDGDTHDVGPVEGRSSNT